MYSWFWCNVYYSEAPIFLELYRRKCTFWFLVRHIGYKSFWRNLLESHFLSSCYTYLLYIFSTLTITLGNATISDCFPKHCFCLQLVVCTYLRTVLCSIETITLGGKRIGIKTSVLEEKATACNMLCCYADELKEGFYPWIDQVANDAVAMFPH